MKVNRPNASEAFGITPAVLPATSSTVSPAASTFPSFAGLDDDTAAQHARQLYGDGLPEGLLSSSQYKSYERMFGAPDIISEAELEREFEAVADESNDLTGTGVLREAEDGSLEEVEYTAEAEEEDADIDAALSHLEKEWKTMDEDEHIMYLDDVRYFKLEQYLRSNDKDEEADELLQCLFLHYEAKVEAEARKRAEVENENTEEEILIEEVIEEEMHDSEDTELAGEATQRTHPFTEENRFTTFPSTVTLPQSALVGPVSAIISGTSPVHLADAAKRIFGGDGLPYSTSNPSFAKSMPQKAIPLDPSLDRMSDIEADSYFAAVMPGTYASVMSALVESRKRLGSGWLESLLQKEGGPRILDAGSAGAGVVAFRSLLRAEWQRLSDNSDDEEASKGLAPADGRAGGAPVEAPTGKATVLASSDTMRKRASVLLDNTTFIPRLPDYIHASDPSAAQHGKFDVIIAPHTLWPLKEEYLRKQYVANLWSLLNADGGLLVLVEKGVPRGFEMIAGARKFLLDTRIASPGNEKVAEEVDEPGEGHVFGVTDKGKGMIIAPCTNHSGCPMYTKPGMSAGRKDYCHFEQRYTRPPYLQKLLRAKDKNHEDVQFSYLTIMRGRDLRDRDEQAIVQGDTATSRAFEGYEHMEPEEFVEDEFDPTAPAISESSAIRTSPHGLMLPRAVFSPLKRTGHVILDLCTPSGTLERWTVPRSFSKQAFRDARKSQWGDLWALGAKTRVAREGVTMSAKAKRKLAEQPPKRKRAQPIIYDVPVDGGSGKVQEGGIKPLVGGRLRRGKISGVRDKRDKTGSGRGRKKASAVD
ncbi:hypothetical protein KVT40_007918 [Elsinoe batatas]|uniref:Uncharacterized protein n=1 Tax=Elsinoe batatas TaxID=2601811 RepID=A0A8K0KVK6_9PEZI|nr:hypothetical protein KVT40_007918 [Elsinoe batatas]